MLHSFLRISELYFTVTVNYQLSRIKKVLAILSHGLSSFITGFVTPISLQKFFKASPCYETVKYSGEERMK